MKPNTTHSKSKTFHQGIRLEDVVKFVKETVETEYRGIPADPPKNTVLNAELKTKYVVTVTKYNT